jgi:glutaredoxin-like protein NrdH
MNEGLKKVRLFSLSTCPVCKKTVAFLKASGVTFEKIEVDTMPSGEQWLMTKELKKYNPEATYPTAVVEEIVVGYDEEALKKALDIR